MANSSG